MRTIREEAGEGSGSQAPPAVTGRTGGRWSGSTKESEAASRCNLAETTIHDAHSGASPRYTNTCEHRSAQRMKQCFPGQRSSGQSLPGVRMKQLSFRAWGIRCIFVAVAALALVVGSPLASAHSASQNSASGRWTVRGHLVPAVRNLKPTATADGARALDLSIGLSLRNQSALAQLIADQNNPHSALYHQYLTPLQFAAQFSPTQATVNAVTSWLHSQGLVVHSVSSNRTLIDASGSVATVERAFQTSISNYSVHGRSAYAPTAEPSVPDALSGMIVNIGGLDNVGVYTHAPIVQPRATGPRAGSGPGGGYTPSELRTAYDMNSLISSADGTGQTVAIFELDGYKTSDVNAYLSNYS